MGSFQYSLGLKTNIKKMFICPSGPMPALMLDVHTDFSVDVGPPRRLMFQKRIAFKTGGLNRPSLQSQTSGERQFTSEESAP